MEQARNGDSVAQTVSGWLGGWLCRKSHVINAAAGAGSNYQVQITVYYGSGTDNANVVYANRRCKQDFGDIRFTASDGRSLLDYWMESAVKGGNAVFWVEIAGNLSTNPATIYVYFGNANATYPSLADDTAQGDSTFLFFDHFLGTTLNVTNKWTKDANITATLSNSIAYFKKATTLWQYVTSKNTYGAGSVAMRSLEHTGTNYSGVYGSYHGFVSGMTNNVHMYWDNQNRFTSIKAGVDNTELITSCATYKGIDLEWLPASCLMFMEGVQVGTTHDATTTPIVALPNAFGLYAMDWYVDWTLIRKFVSPEPSHGAWGTEVRKLRLPSQLASKIPARLYSTR